MPETKPVAEPESNQVFQPSIFEQIEELEKETPSHKEGELLPKEEKKSEELPTYTAEDIAGLVEAPFDFMAWKTKFPQWKLDEKQTERLSKLWLKPIVRLCAKVGAPAEIVIASFTTLAIVLEKQLEFMIEKDNQEQALRAYENQVREAGGEKTNGSGQ